LHACLVPSQSPLVLFISPYQTRQTTGFWYERIPQKYAAMSGPAEKSVSSVTHKSIPDPHLIRTISWHFIIMKLSQAKKMWCAPNKDLWLTPKANSMGVVGPRGVKKTWLDSTRLSLEDLCFKLSNFVFVFSFSQTKWSNSMWVSKSLIKITNPWKERRKEEELPIEQANCLHTQNLCGAETWSITKPHKLFLFLKLRNFPSKKFCNKLLSLYFPPPFFLLFFPLFFGVRMRRLIMVSATNTYWTLVPIWDLKRDLEMSSWDLNHLLLLSLSLSLSLSTFAVSLCSAHCNCCLQHSLLQFLFF
jgi:hypothetical protein